MKKMLRFLLFCFYSLLGLVTLCAALFAYFIYSADPELPQLSGTVTKTSIEVDGLNRIYRTYLPKGLAKDAPLVFVMHGSGQNGAQIRIETGYGFERLADQFGFAVVYPNSSSSDWNDCSKVGDFSVNGHEVDDVKFLNILVNKLITDIGVNQARVFATGVSSGGMMAMRLAIEAPEKFRAVAAVSANVPTANNFKCTPTGQGTSVLIMNGTKDPLIPFAGGESSLFGLFYKSGTVRSSSDSALYFAEQGKITGRPTINSSPVVGELNVGHAVWRDNSKLEVELVTIHGGGHGLPQPFWRRPRLLGPSPMTPNGAAMIWDFFERQKSQVPVRPKAVPLP
ncbi:alpha/beta hydrolase family esterase [Undibacterium sp. Ji22W]|uniref:alpha/beta hydrolase family esterase n=1 Tax=Undibacterium sp. Ji22W TaxID=3413038 RepID=UPI003BF09586